VEPAITGELSEERSGFSMFLLPVDPIGLARNRLR